MGVRSVFCAEPQPAGGAAPGQLGKTTSNAQPRGILQKVRSVFKGELGNSSADQHSGPSPWPEVDAQSPNVGAKAPSGFPAGSKGQSPSKDITATAAQGPSLAQTTQAVRTAGAAPMAPTVQGATANAQPAGTARPGSAKSKGPSRVNSRSNSTAGRLMGLLKSGNSKDFNRAPEPKSARITENNPRSVRVTESNYDFTDPTRKRPSDAQVSISPNTRPGGILGVPETILDSNNSLDGIQGVPAPIILVGTQTRAGPLKTSPTPQSDLASGQAKGSQVSDFAAITSKHAAASDQSASSHATAPSAADNSTGPSTAANTASKTAISSSQAFGAQTTTASQAASRSAAVNPQATAGAVPTAPTQVASGGASPKKPITSLEDVDAMVPQQSEHSSDFITSSRSQYNRSANTAAKGNGAFGILGDQPVTSRDIVGSSSNNGPNIMAAPGVSVSSSTRFGRIWDHPDDAPKGNASNGGTDTAIGGSWQLGLNPDVGQQSTSRSGQMLLAASAGFPPTSTGHVMTHGDEPLGGGIQRTWSQEGGMLHEPSHVAVSSPTKTVRVLDRAGSGDIPKAKVTLGHHTRMGGFQDWGDEVTQGQTADSHQRSHLAPRELQNENEHRNVLQPHAAALVGPPRLEQHVPPASAFSNADAQSNNPVTHSGAPNSHHASSGYSTQPANGAQQGARSGPMQSENRQMAGNGAQGREDEAYSGGQSLGEAGRRSHATKASQEHFNKSVREIERAGSGTDIPQSKVTMGPKTRLGGFGDWPQDQAPSRSSAPRAAAPAAAPEASSGYSSFTTQAPSAQWGQSGGVSGAAPASTPRTQDAVRQGPSERPTTQGAASEASFSTPKRPTGVGQGAGLSSHAIELSADKYGGHYDNGVLSTPDELYTTAESIPTPLLVRGQGGNSYSRNEAGFGSPGSQAGGNPGGARMQEATGSKAKVSKGLTQAGSRDKLALDSDGEEWLTAEGVRSAGSPEMKVSGLGVADKRPGNVATGQHEDIGKIKAHAFRPRIQSEEDAPMSPSTVKAKGYWMNTAGPRLRPSESGAVS